MAKIIQDYYFYVQYLFIVFVFFFCIGILVNYHNAAKGFDAALIGSIHSFQDVGYWGSWLFILILCPLLMFLTYATKRLVESGVFVNDQLNNSTWKIIGVIFFFFFFVPMADHFRKQDIKNGADKAIIVFLIFFGFSMIYMGIFRYSPVLSIHNLVPRYRWDWDPHSSWYRDQVRHRERNLQAYLTHRERQARPRPTLRETKDRLKQLANEAARQAKNTPNDLRRIFDRTRAFFRKPAAENPEVFKASLFGKRRRRR